MLLQDFLNNYNTIKKGQFTKATWQSVKVIEGIECKKISSGVIRLVKYANIKNVVVAGKVNTNEQCLITNILYYNAKTQNYLVQLATTEVKPHCKYYLNGVEVSKEEFEKINPPKQHLQQNPVFRVKLENLLEIGN